MSVRALLDRQRATEDVEVPFDKFLAGWIEVDKSAADSLFVDSFDPDLDHRQVPFPRKTQRQSQELPVTERAGAIGLDIEPDQTEVQNTGLHVHPHDGYGKVELTSGLAPKLPVDREILPVEFDHG